MGFWEAEEKVGRLDLGEEGMALDEHSAVLVVGLGKTGYSIARFLDRLGVRFAITDTRDTPPCLKAFRENFPDAGVFLGGFSKRVFEAATHLVVSPGVSVHHPLIQAQAQRGVPVLGDVDLFAASTGAPILGITGANGKSTVTTLVGLMAERDGRQVRVGGNLGTPMLDLLDQDADLYVLELSSFQLETAHVLEPLAATVLNISPDHMDRYESIAAYAAAKERIFKGRGLMVLNQDDPEVLAMNQEGRRVAWFSLTNDKADYAVRKIEGVDWLCAHQEPRVKVSEIKLEGRHNLANCLAAMALGDEAGLAPDAMKDVMTSFRGLPHRSEWVADIDGVRYINDSKATNVGACMAALAGMERPAVLIAGGDGKGADFRVLRQVVEGKVKAMVLIGRDGPLIEEALKGVVPTRVVTTLQEAVPAARLFAGAGDVVILAPACASLDQFQDYQARGRAFVEAVGKLKP